MKKHTMPFFATETDLYQLLERVMVAHPLKILPGGLFDSPTLEIVQLPIKLDPGKSYLICDAHLQITIRTVPQRKGGCKYAIDQLVNPETIALRAGGLIAENCLIAGQIGTATNNQASKKIYSIISTEIQQSFSQIKSFYLGNEALQFLDRGVRLTINSKSSPLYDLSRTS